MTTIATELDTLRLVLRGKNETIDGMCAELTTKRAELEAERKRSARWKYAAKRFLHRAQMCRGLWEADGSITRHQIEELTSKLEAAKGTK